jgi:hypothetical protein
MSKYLTWKRGHGVKSKYTVRSIAVPTTWWVHTWSYTCFVYCKYFFNKYDVIMTKTDRTEEWLSRCKLTTCVIDKNLISTSLDKNFITAWTSITKLVIFQSFVAKCCKMRIINCEVCRFSVILHYAGEIDKPIPFGSVNFPFVIQNDWKTANFARLYYPHFTTFRNETLEYY